MFTVKQLQHPKTHFKTSYQSVKNVTFTVLEYVDSEKQHDSETEVWCSGFWTSLISNLSCDLPPQVTSTFLNFSFPVCRMEVRMLRPGSYFSGYFLREPDKKLQAPLPKNVWLHPKICFQFPSDIHHGLPKICTKRSLRLLYTLKLLCLVS